MPLLHEILDQVKNLSKRMDQMKNVKFVAEPVKLDLPVFKEEKDFAKREDVVSWSLFSEKSTRSFQKMY